MIKRTFKSQGTHMATDNRARLLSATAELLAEEGISAVSARRIGARAEANPSLIYYHFGDLDGLLAETTRAMTANRGEAYRDRLSDVSSLSELSTAARALHAEERANGNLAMLAQLLAGSRTHPGLAPVLNDNFELLVAEVAATLDRILSGTALDGLLDADQVGRAVSAGFIGIELLDTVRHEDDPAMFDTLDTVTSLVDLVLNAGTIPTSLIRRRLRTPTK